MPGDGKRRTEVDDAGSREKADGRRRCREASSGGRIGVQVLHAGSPEEEAGRLGRLSARFRLL
jgi:hypothetical protein